MPASRHGNEREHALTADAVREVGVLLVAFSPLDGVFAGTATSSLLFGLLFFLLGLLLFRMRLKMEGKNGAR